MHTEQQQESLYSCGVYIATHGALRGASEDAEVDWVHVQTETLTVRDRVRIGHPRSAVAWMTRTVFRISTATT